MPNQAEIHAHPQDTEEQRAIAHHLGYPDTTALTLDHDPCHAWLAHIMGLSASPALLSASGEYVDQHITGLEEQAVLAIQAYCVALGIKPWDQP